MKRKDKKTGQTAAEENTPVEVKKTQTSDSGEKTVSARRKKIGPTLDFASTEAYNLLRTNVMFSFPEGPGAKVIGITSPCPQEGKSFTTVNLAYSTAEAGFKVIIVDCDLRRPSVYKNFEIPLSPGLSNLLVNDERTVVHSGILHENLHVITAGDIPPNPSELLGSDRMKSILDTLREKFDYIYLDLPPILSVADPLVISKYLDGIIVVTRHNTTRRNDLNETIRQLSFSKVHILGIVYNSYGTGGSGYYKSKYYRRNYKGYYKGYYQRHYYTSSVSSKSSADKK